MALLRWVEYTLPDCISPYFCLLAPFTCATRMNQTSPPTRWKQWSKILGILSGSVSLVALLQATTCDNQDYGELQTIPFAGKNGELVVSKTIFNSYAGRNAVDFTVENIGADPMMILISARTTQFVETEMDVVEDTVEDMVMIDLDLGLVDNSDVVEVIPDDVVEGDDGELADLTNPLGTRTRTINPGEIYVDRFSEDELSTGVTLIVEVQCLTSICDGVLEFVPLLGQVECRDDLDCSSDQICNDRVGRCIAAPVVEEGCTQRPSPAPVSPTGFALTWLAGLAWTARRTYQSHKRANHAQRPRASSLSTTPQRRLFFWCAIVATVLALSAAPDRAWAGRGTFDQATSQFTAGTGTKIWTGKLAELASPGIALEFTQALQWRWISYQITIDTAYFLTNQQIPPLSRGLQTYSLRTGPRFVAPLGSFRAYLDTEYERLGVISNSLVKTTGPQLNYHGVGGSVGFGWVSSFLAEIRGGYTHIFGLDSGLVTVEVRFGIIGKM